MLKGLYYARARLKLGPFKFFNACKLDLRKYCQSFTFTFNAKCVSCKMSNYSQECNKKNNTGLPQQLVVKTMMKGVQK